MKRNLAMLLSLSALSTVYADDIVINELMASNVGVVMSPATNFDSWIELYNTTDKEVNLAGMYLSDEVNNLTKWCLPNNIGAIPAKGFLVVWLGSDDIMSNQAPFKLDCDGGTIYLSDRSKQLVTSVDYPEALSRTAYARTTDGGSKWGWTAYPTPGITNTTSDFATQRLNAPIVNEGSQLFNGSLSVKVDIPDGAMLMYTTDGSVPTASKSVGGSGSNEQPEWKNWIKNGDCEGDDVSCLVGKSGDENGNLTTHILDGIGYQGSRGIKVHSIDNPEQVWDSQFFVYTPDHIWASGDRYHFSMKVRADKPAHITPQTQRTPGSYIHWQMLDGGYDVTTEWHTIDYEGTITDEQAGDGAMQTIAFHLNESSEANNFYFDDIVWESYNEPGISADGSARQSTDGLFTVTRTTNYVFRLFRDGYLPSVPVTRSYIKADNTYTVPVISIVGNEKYFTDPMWGIDIKGTNGIPGNGSDDPVNWNQPWDRPVNFSYISPTEGMLFNQDVNISVSGGWTRSNSPRSMKLKSNKIFDGQNHLDYSFFPQKPYIRNKTLLVRNGGNDVWNSHSRFMDPALTTVIQRSGIDLDVQSCVQVVEYVNGRFKGVLNLREPSNDKFVYANYGYDDEEIDMFENGLFKNGTDEVFKHLCQLGKNIEEPGAYEEVKRLLDVDEFTNYMAAELFLGNDDWPENNVKAYRSQDDGRFRFICFDLDYTFNPWGRSSFLSLNDHQDVKMVSLFLNLLRNDEYRRKFIDTFCIMAGSVFEKERATAIVDELADAMRPMSQLDGYLPDNAATKIKNQLKTRLEEMTNLIKQYGPMKLSGTTMQSVTLAADTDGAGILVNGINVPYAFFNGRLFAPVTLEAKAPVGYTFKGWRKQSGSTVPVINTGDTWKYFDKGRLPAEEWFSTDYNDASWSRGEAPLGYKTSGVKTTVSYGSDSQNKYPTTFFRKTFTLSATPQSGDIFLLRYQVDDGCIVRINGQEAGRVNMPDGTVVYNSFSTTYAGDEPLAGTLELSPSLFKEGENVIAVEVHNNSYTSSDLFWACELYTSVGTETDENYLTEPVISLPKGDKLSLVACFTPLISHLPPVCINEVSAANGIYVNEYFKRNDWIELYNTTNQDIDVEGMYLSDNLDKPKKYQISNLQSSTPSLQSPTVIPAHGYLIVWCDKLEPESQLHASFKLDADGGDVLLTAADDSWSDRISYTAMKEDETIGRYPDGSANVITMNVPTIAKSNIMSSYATVISQPEQSDIRDIMARQTSQQIYNLKGQVVQGTLRPGIYIRNGRKIVIK